MVYIYHPSIYPSTKAHDFNFINKIAPRLTTEFVGLQFSDLVIFYWATWQNRVQTKNGFYFLTRVIKLHELIRQNPIFLEERPIHH